MSAETKWYYVEKNERKGPVSFENLQHLSARGTIVADTLVWKEGMQDWEKASAIKGLVNARSSINVTPNRPKSPSQKSSPIVAPAAKSTPAPASIVTTAAPPANPDRSTDLNREIPSGAASGELEFSSQTPAPASHLSGFSANHLIARSKSIGYPCLIIGFLLVISGKGCDSLGSRWVKGTVVAADLAKNRFEASYAAKENAYQAQINDLNNSDNPNLDRIKSLNDKISQLNKKRNEERRELQVSTWSTLTSNATMASDRYHSWGFTRELVFVFGSMVLSVGLLVVGITGEGSEKWVCLIMLAIITFSIYVGGFAWSASLQSILPTMR